MAQLILEIYGRKSSVLYDLSAITDLIATSLDADQSKLSLYANLLYFSLVQIYQNKDQCNHKELQVSFSQFWKLASSHLTLEKLNSLLKPTKTNSEVVEPILKCVFIML